MPDSTRCRTKRRKMWYDRITYPLRRILRKKRADSDKGAVL